MRRTLTWALSAALVLASAACADDDPSGNNGASNNSAANNTSTNNTSANNTATNNTSANNTSANNTSTNNTSANNTSTNNSSGAECGPDIDAACPMGEYCKPPEGMCAAAGTCEVMPQGCPEFEMPVCGCDGQTYSNDCFAAAAGVGVASQGACAVEACGEGECGPMPPIAPPPVCEDGTTVDVSIECARQGDGSCSWDIEYGMCPDFQACGADGDPACPEGAYCEKTEGMCADQGICLPRPMDCTTEYQPVCGCDGVTYGNSCEANAAGTSVASQGECPAPGCGRDGDPACPPDQYCHWEVAAMCGASGDAGECRDVPMACTKELMPVCGCDGQTYDNTCYAHAAGVSVASTGACEATCGGIAGLTCGNGEYCAYAAGTCDVADRAGTCAPLPQFCPAVVMPVCGCDGKTYNNDCEAAAAGISVDYTGECKPQACGGATGVTCPRGEFCKAPEGMCAAQGVCEAPPTVCPRVVDPVCGCDGTTYNNSCEAYAAGVSVAAQGACASTNGCGTGPDCGRGEYCAAPSGTCDTTLATASCKPLPMFCPAVFMPVCGCDRMTYGNACEAAAAGVNVSSNMACP